MSQPETAKRARRRAYEKLPFEPLNPEAARALADKATELLHERPQPPTPCAICVHPEMADINFRLLVGEDCRQIGEDYGLHSVGYARTIRVHRDTHLVPLIHDGALTGILALQLQLYPPDGNESQRRHWYIMQAYGIRAQAIKEKNWYLALKALHEMRESETASLTPTIAQPKQLNEEPRGVEQFLPPAKPKEVTYDE